MRRWQCERPGEQRHREGELERDSERAAPPEHGVVGDCAASDCRLRARCWRGSERWRPDLRLSVSQSVSLELGWPGWALSVFTSNECYIQLRILPSFLALLFSDTLLWTVYDLVTLNIFSPGQMCINDWWIIFDCDCDSDNMNVNIIIVSLQC